MGEKMRRDYKANIHKAKMRRANLHGAFLNLRAYAVFIFGQCV